ncbi:MAG: hypothetical protein WC130_12645 [Kiritimatiellia bacterium]
MIDEAPAKRPRGRPRKNPLHPNRRGWKAEGGEPEPIEQDLEALPALPEIPSGYWDEGKKIDPDMPMIGGLRNWADLLDANGVPDLHAIANLGLQEQIRILNMPDPLPDDENYMPMLKLKTSIAQGFVATAQKQDENYLRRSENNIMAKILESVARAELRLGRVSAAPLLDLSAAASEQTP